MTEIVVLVDEQDQPIGTAEKMAAHQQGLLHRAFSVFVVRKVGTEYEILLQQRNNDKYHCGGLWTNTCCSHPRVNEEITDAAQRRLHEEMGLQLNLHKLGSFIYKAEFENSLIEHEYDHVLLGFYNDEAININPDEVQNFTWMLLSELEDSLMMKPELYTPWLQPALAVVQTSLAEIYE